MKNFTAFFILFILALGLTGSRLEAQDTFSITAVDPITGLVGSAGASCIAGSIILSDVHPNRGVIHSQASYIAGNQNYARNLMNMGLSPQQIIDSVVLHDVQNNPTGCTGRQTLVTKTLCFSSLICCFRFYDRPRSSRRIAANTYQ